MKYTFITDEQYNVLSEDDKKIFRYLPPQYIYPKDVEIIVDKDGKRHAYLLSESIERYLDVK